MFNRKRPSSHPQDLLPWYLNQTLNPAEREQVECWLADQGPEALRRLEAWQQVRAAARSQPQPNLAPDVRQQVVVRAQATSYRRPQAVWLPWLSGAVLAALVLVVLWNVVRPGIGLQWSVSGDQPAAFRIYRAPLGSDRFEVVGEVAVHPPVADYTFVDTTPWLGQSYQYRVEAVNQAAVSATIAADGAEVLPLQMAIVAGSMLTGFAAIFFMRELTTLRHSAFLKAL